MDALKGLSALALLVAAIAFMPIPNEGGPTREEMNRACLAATGVQRYDEAHTVHIVMGYAAASMQEWHPGAPIICENGQKVWL